MDDTTETGVRKSEYSKVWINTTLFFIIFILFLIVVLVIDYYSTGSEGSSSNFGPVIKLFSGFKKYFFIIISIYLLIFGYYTLIDDETNENIKAQNERSIDIGTITKINNDDISIYSILIGFIVCFMCCIEVIFYRS